MGFELIDGTGKGNKARVDKKHHISVASRARTDAQIIAMEGNHYTMDSGKVTLTANGGKVLWWKFEETEKVMLADHIAVNWNGGNTNYNRPVDVVIWANDPAPTANHTAGFAANTNVLSSNVVVSTVYKWDGVGDGMTIAAGGYPTSNYIFAPGYTLMALHHKWIFGPNTAVTLYAKGYEVGNIAFQVGFSVMTIDDFRTLIE